MTTDPVCGMQVDEKKTTLKSTYEGKQYSFCGRKCKEMFDEDPDRYVEIETPEEMARP